MAQAKAGFGQASRQLIAQEGWKSLTLGMASTNYGYLVQGFFKYGLYELGKNNGWRLIGREAAEKHSHWLYLTSGMMAELIADVALTPFEALRIRQVAQPGYAPNTWLGLQRIVKEEGGVRKGLYRGFVPLVLKQVPYTAVKLTVFEACEEFIYDHLDQPRSQMPKTQQLSISALSGLVGGMVSAIASHPADTLLTRINTEAGLKGLGWRSIWAGLTPRMGMVGILAALQLLVYDASKVYLFGLPTSTGIKHQREAEAKVN